MTERQTVNITEAAKILGVSPTTIHQMIKDGKIPFILLGRERKVILRETIEKILDQGRLKQG